LLAILLTIRISKQQVDFMKRVGVMRKERGKERAQQRGSWELLGGREELED
jgi:hypothetical protein